MLHLATNLKKFRKTANLTQVVAAERAGIEYKHYQKIEGHQWDDLRISTLVRLANTLATSPAELLMPPP